MNMATHAPDHELTPSEVAAAAAERNKCSSRTLVYTRATLAITGCMMFWLGASMLLEELSQIYYKRSGDHTAEDHADDSTLHCDACTESTPTRNGVFILLGLAFFLATGTVAIHAGVEDSIQSAPAADGATVADGPTPAAVSAPPPPPRSRSRLRRFLHHPLLRHIRALISLTGVMMLWEGIWDAAFDAEAEAAGWPRMLIFACAGMLGLQITDSLFSNAGVVPPFALAKRSMHVQQRLGFHLQEQKFVRAQQGGHMHDADVMARFAEQQQRTRSSSHPNSGGALSDDAPPSPSVRSAMKQVGRGPSFHSLPTTDEQQRPGNVPSPVLTPPKDSVQALAHSKAPFSALAD